MPFTIVVGTSRCGSTMLSRMLRRHPEVLSISEFWSSCFMDAAGDIPTRDMAGDEFWQLISTPASSYDGLVRAGIKEDDHLLPWSSRFDYATGVPPVCRMLGLVVAESPDPLFDELAPVVSAWPRQSTAEHCRALFADLAARLGRRIIVERSGGSIGYVEHLHEMFPEARFVFLHRDGPDTALSMSRYPTLRLVALRKLANIVATVPRDQLKGAPTEILDTTPEEFKALTEPPFDKDRFLAYPVPVAFYGWLWADWTQAGVRGLRNVRRDRVMTLRYERLLEDNRSEIARLGAFIGADADEEWLDKTSALVEHGRVGSAAAQLDPGELAWLREACAPGAQAFDLLESELNATAGR